MKTLLFSLFMTSMAWGQVSQVSIKNFNFNYQAPQGDGTAESFSYQQKLVDTQKVHVEKIGDDFKFIFEGVENQELTLRDAPDLMKSAQQIKMSAFNLSFASSVSLSAVSAIFNSPDKNIDLKNLNLACNRISTFPEVMDQVINGCIQKMSLKTAALTTDGESGFDQALMKAIDETHDEILGGVGIKNLNLKVTGGKFELSTEVKAQISGTATATGTIKYEAPVKKLTVKISEVKFGFLDLTSKVFDELKKQESATLKVSKPYVYITIK
jgi:hypothetical protein